MPSNFTPVKSATRVLGVLDLLSTEPEGLSYAEIQRRTGWPRSSTYNLLQTMLASGYLELGEDGQNYRVGLRAWEVGQAYRRCRDLASRAMPHLRRACQRLNETVQLAVLDGLDNVYIAKVDADHPVKLVSEIGSRLPAYATGLGKVLLAGLDEAELARRLEDRELEPFTDRTITSKEQLLEVLYAVREQGFGTDEEEYTLGVFCVAVPVRDEAGAVVAAMSSSIARTRVSREHIEGMRLVLTEEATRVSNSLGFKELHTSITALP